MLYSNLDYWYIEVTVLSVLALILYAWCGLVDMTHNSQGLGCSRVKHCVESKWLLIDMEWNYASLNSVTIVF